MGIKHGISPSERARLERNKKIITMYRTMQEEVKEEGEKKAPITYVCMVIANKLGISQTTAYNVIRANSK